MVSIPRDMYVKIPGDGEAKINQAYTTGFLSTDDIEERGKAGAEVASQVVAEVAGVPVHYYVTADFTGFKEVVDIIGGITVDVEKELYDPLYPNEGFTADGQYYKTDDYDPLLVEVGVQTMDGELALKYARSRHGTGISDFDRAYRQQQILYSIKEKALSLGVLANPDKITDIAATVGDHIRISMSPSELREFLEIFSKSGQGDVINEVIDNSEDGLLVSSNNGSSILLPRAGDYTQINAFVKNIFSTVVLKDVEVEVLNGSDVVGQAGELAEELEEAGFNVTNIDNYEGEMEKTTIQDGTRKGEVFIKLSEYIDTFEHTGFDKEGTIVIIIGQDYAN
jgi:LCP family protein required for cell wall assembly